MGSASRYLMTVVAIVALGTGTVFVVAAAGGIDTAGEDDEGPQSATAATVVPGGDGAEGSSESTSTPEETGDPIDVEVPGRTGGAVTLAAQRWPECLNAILTECADNDFLHFTVAEQVLPKLMELDAAGAYVPSPVLEEAPTIANEGIVEDPLVITYRIDPDARWNDGTAITSADVVFTWQAILSTDGAVDQEAYEAVEVTDLGGQTVEVKFDEPTSNWQELFGGTRGYVLQASQFLRTDLSEAMLTEIPFSGGPWILEEWDDEQAVLAANPDYWDPNRIPRLDRVHFVPRVNQGPDPGAVLVDGVDATFRPSVERVRRPERDVEVSIGRNSEYQALWFNQEGILTDRRVRQALELAVPRAVILDEIVHEQFPELPLLQCVGWVPTLGPWCGEGDYATFRWDLNEAADILDSAGWTPGADGIRVNSQGEPLQLTFMTLATDDALREIQQTVQASAALAGFDLRVDNASTQASLNDRLARRDYGVALAGAGASPEPSVTALFSCEAIPDADNDFIGDNITGWCNQAADQRMRQLDRAVDRSVQLELVRTIGDLLTSDHVALPLVQDPSMFAWRPSSLRGPVDRFLNSPYSPFWNIYEWTLPAEEPAS